jgi:predicted nucleic acid-binding protein
MDVVVDTSVIVAVIANESAREALVKLTAGADLIAPHSVHWEIGNALSAMLKRGRITVKQAIEAVQIYQEIPLRHVDVELEETLAIADARGIYAYDAYLIRCAEKYRAPLVSLDKALIAAAQETGVTVMEVVV